MDFCGQQFDSRSDIDFFESGVYVRIPDEYTPPRVFLSRWMYKMLDIYFDGGESAKEK